AAFFLLAFLSGCALFDDKPKRERTPEPPEERLIVAYEVEIDAPSELRDLLLTHLDLTRFQRTRQSERPSATELNRLAIAAPAQAKALLETAGYFDAEVSVEPVRAGRVVLHVMEGAPVTVASVDFALAEPRDPAEAEALLARIKRAWRLATGDVFTQADWSGAKSSALAALRGEGYPLVHWADSAARVDTAAHAVTLELKLDPGPRFLLGAVQIEGLKRVPAEVIERLANFKPGQPYTERALLEFQERIQKTQLFDSISVDISREASDAAATPVYVKVTEAIRQQATTGVGYSANTGQRVTLEYLNRQPFGLPMRARSKIDYGRDLKSAEVELSSYPQPDLQRNLASLQAKEDRSGDAIVTSLDLRVGRSREAAQDERLYYLQALRSNEQSDLGSVRAAAFGANIQWIRRRLDAPLLPTEGYSARLLLGAGRADSSAQESGMFGRVDFQASYYKPLGNFYATARTQVSSVITRQSVGIPEPLLFRAGGDDSVRGYAYQSLGPQRNGVDVGGRAMWTGSVELARPILARMPDILGAVFVDAGQAAQSFGELRPVLGWGFGARWRSPVGPLRVDLARGQATGKWRLGFSIAIPL
ncbi:MAG TPA: BamA/TamA family outer membrane protein, partial [Burkholderiaceae bacterium]